MKNDKEKKLFEEIGGIGDDLIEEAQAQLERRRANRM